MQLLLIEDDAVLGQAVKTGLSEAGHTCQWLMSGKDGLDAAMATRVEAIILDLMIPDLSGMEVMRRLREAGNSTPILILTALGSVNDRVSGLKAGADDYLVKPFAFPELLARLEVIGRRAADTHST